VPCLRPNSSRVQYHRSGCLLPSVGLFSSFSSSPYNATGQRSHARQAHGAAFGGRGGKYEEAQQRFTASLNAAKEAVRQSGTLLEKLEEEEKVQWTAARSFVEVISATRPLNLAALEDLGSKLRRSVLVDDDNSLDSAEFLKVDKPPCILGAGVPKKGTLRGRGLECRFLDWMICLGVRIWGSSAVQPREGQRV
jgi:hypothetical protein